MKTNRMALGSWISILLLALVVNLPAIYGGIASQRLSSSGVETVGTVVAARASGGHYVIAFRLPPSVDPKQQTWPASVDQATYDRAVGQRTVSVRVLKGQPNINKVDGEQTSHTALWLALVCDAVLVLLVLALRRRAARRDELDEYVAVGDVTEGLGAPALEPMADGTVVVAGEVEHSDAQAITVRTPLRLVRVLLDGHRNPVGDGEPVRVLTRRASGGS